MTTQEHQEEESVHRALERFYRAGKAPWDTGVTPPELVALVEGHGALPPGRALELGCGTGTNAIYLARHGWQVTAVDLIDSAVDQARQKTEAAGVAVDLLHGDATRLDDLAVAGSFDLFFDLSCYCGIPLHRRDAYATGLTRRAAPGARLLMFGYGPEPAGNPLPPVKSWAEGVTADELRARFPGWDLLDVTPGTNSVPTFWFTLRRAT
ncbi:class I SAM-dependent methyltransferase [Nonomuraea sp. NPDC050663]|uniref:class I SAM-dependent methyltransferase n=1 Tax=Nonomuraea sp. NPDC050663 TaxID=3364370 RepID=UPI0037A4C305